jgi:hypothetical protein
MTLLSFIALALGMAAATADRIPRPNMARVAVTRASRASARVEQRPTVRTPAPAVRHARLRGDSRPQRRPVAPLRGAAAARAPGVCC